MESIDALKAKHAATLAKLESELAIAAALPLTPDAVQFYAKRPSWISYRDRTLTQALDVIRAFQIVPFYEFRGTFCQLVPQGQEDSKAQERGGPYAIALNVSSGERFGPSAKLFFYSTLPNGDSIRVNIELAGPGYIGSFDRLAGSRKPVAYDKRGNVTQWLIGPNHIGLGHSDSYVQWSTGDDKTGQHSYLFCADTESPAMGGDMTHAIGQLVNMRDELQPTTEKESAQ